MDNLNDNIYQNLLASRSVLLVGQTDSGKTRYAKESLVPFLENKGIEVTYCPDPDCLPELKSEREVFIIDEIETLIDKDFLESRSVEGRLYYSGEYLARVKNWHEKLKNLDAPSVVILTRNGQKEIDNILENLKVTDWGTEIVSYQFPPK